MIMAERWPSFMEFLRTQLGKDGNEDPSSSEELLAFIFPLGSAVFGILLASLQITKQEFKWDPANGSVPIQILLDIIPAGQPTQQYKVDAAFWSELRPETIYVSLDLQRQWAAMQEVGEKFPAHTLAPYTPGFYQLLFMDHDIGKQEQLLVYRSLPVFRPGEPCFYCAMTGHSPAQCPSKYLAMDAMVIDEVGYLPLAELNEIYRRIFPERTELVAKLREGVKTADLRKDKELMVFAAYLDVFAIYQPRFLWNFVFSGYHNWESLCLTDKIRINNQNLHIALDCLRVRQYEQADGLLQKEIRRQGGNRFAAYIGLAFLALEQNWPAEVEGSLEQAYNNASSDIEVVYANLLLSRYHELAGNLWDAAKAVKNAMKVQYDCQDIQYRRLQIAVREDFTDRDPRMLRNLVVGQKETFFKALFDPLLLPIQGFNESLLSHQYKTLQREARQRLTRARLEVEALDPWLEETDIQRAEDYTSLVQLQEQLERDSYYDYLDVSERSNGIFTRCNRQRRERTENLRKKLVQQGNVLKNYLEFWDGYPHKKFFKKLAEILETILPRNREALVLLDDESGESIRKALSLAEGLDKDQATLLKEYDRLLGLETLIRGGVILSRKLVVCEAYVLLFLALIFPIAGALLPDVGSLSFFVNLAHNHGLRNSAFFFSSTVLAPFLALIWTMYELQSG